MKAITPIFNDNNNRGISFEAPDVCPLCHHSLDPIVYFAYCNKEKWDQNNCLQVIYRCTRKSCQNLFISYYKAGSSQCTNFYYKESKPLEKTKRQFTETITSISPNFSEIYNQALIAENDGLEQICGVGYRKALEFLIKDYLIRKNPDKEDTIKNKFLVDCINKEIKNDNIKAMAKRATWLGNDETHYLKKWEGKDLQDMKKMIDATIYWIEMEKLTENTQEEMPEN